MLISFVNFTLNCQLPHLHNLLRDVGALPSHCGIFFLIVYWTKIKSRGNRFWFESARGSSYRGFELSGVKELKQRRFWVTHVNRKWGLFPFYTPGHYQISIAEFLFSYKDDLPEGFNQTTAHMLQKVHFRLTSVAQKRCCLSSLLSQCAESRHITCLPESN